jgi:RNA polymerase sigma-70 factor (ECF subfamily)
MPGPAEIDERLASVLTIYLFIVNEGYYSVSQNKTLRKDLCLEAMRLCYILVENKYTNKPSVNALLSLMCFHASRLRRALIKMAKIILYEEQDNTLWNTDLISKGVYFMNCAASGTVLSSYHLQAGIAFWNTQPRRYQRKMGKYICNSTIDCCK